MLGHQVSIGRDLDYGVYGSPQPCFHSYRLRYF
jgi:hypothetical protein